MSAVALDLPEGFVVLDAAETGHVDEPEGESLPPGLQDWLAEVQATRASSGAALVAVQVEQVDGDVVAVSLVAHLHPLEDEPLEVVVQGLRALALARTSPAGEVSVLDLPCGPAVASAEVVASGDRGPAALVALQLPLPALGQLLTLTLSTPTTARLADCAALAAALACRIRVGEQVGDAAPDEDLGSG